MPDALPTAAATAVPALDGPEQRIAPRHRCGLAALIQLHVPRTGRRCFAWVHDISASGVALDLRIRLESGEMVRCQLKGTQPAERFEVDAEIVHSDFVEGLYRAGCKFATPLPVPQLEAVLRKLRGG